MARQPSRRPHRRHPGTTVREKAQRLHRRRPRRRDSHRSRLPNPQSPHGRIPLDHVLCRRAQRRRFFQPTDNRPTRRPRSANSRPCTPNAKTSPEHRLLVRILLLNHKLAESKQLALKIAAADPVTADSWIDLADVEYDLEDCPGAIAHLEHALKLDPRSRNAMISLYKCHTKTGDRQKAAELAARIRALGGAWLT